MTTKLSAEQSKKVSSILGRLDKIASNIQDNHEAWGMNFDVARGLVNDIDTVSDEFETMGFGEDSLRHRQVEILREAKVIQREPDEGYMDTFQGGPGAVIQSEADEPYMSAYADDDSSGVRDGADTAGRPFAP
jgi:hypothetical protein